MRRPRVLVDSREAAAVYHCISRTTGGEFLLGEQEKEVMRRQLWIVAEYCGLEIITYALLSNHFHVLVRVPRWRALSDEDLLRRFRLLYPNLKPEQERRIKRIEESMQRGGIEAQSWRQQQQRQMFSASSFMKLFKMRFSIWFNARHERVGTLWAERFKSVLIEDGEALRVVAAYIDLNSVRAGLALDPKDYRFSGYAEALAGNRKAQKGLASLFGAEWKKVAEVYRCILFSRGSASVDGKFSIPTDRARLVGEVAGTLPLDVRLRCRIRYFTDGVILGSESFLATQIARLQKRKMLTRTAAPHPLTPVLGWHEFRVLSRMRKNVFTGGSTPCLGN